MFWAVSLLTMDLITHSLSTVLKFYSIRSLFGMQIFLEPIQCSTPTKEHTVLYFNRFRGKPAISEFDWPFTPNHKSSSFFCNKRKFGPPIDITQCSTCSWLDHPVSGLFT